MISVKYYKINPVHIFFYVLFLYMFHRDIDQGIPRWWKLLVADVIGILVYIL